MSQTAYAPADRGGFRAAYGKFLEWLVGILMVVLFIEVTAGVVFRTLGSPLVWYDEVASMLLAWLTFYGSALASFKRGHIGCPEIIDMLPPTTKRVFSIIAQLVVIGFFGMMGWMGAEIMPILATDFMTSVPSIPMSWVQSVIPISAVLILIAEFMTLADLLKSDRTGKN
jgi:TRAP-type transport system small permease protein